MKNKITLKQVKKDNSNIRQYSDGIWRELRKVRWKHQDWKEQVFSLTPSVKHTKIVLDYASANGLEDYENNDFITRISPKDSRKELEFNIGISELSNKYFTESQDKILRLWLYGNVKQQDIGTAIGKSQAYVSSELKHIFKTLKEQYYESTLQENNTTTYR